MPITEFGWDARCEAAWRPYAIDGCAAGRITLHVKDRYRVMTDAGEVPGVVTGRLLYNALTPGDLPVVGDWVAVRLLDPHDPQAIIHAVLPRNTHFARRDPAGGEQPVAANVDLAFLVTGLDHNFSPRRIERYLTMTRQSGATPVVVLTKADLCDDLPARLAAVEAVAGGAPVHAVSVVQPSGLEALAAYLTPGRTVALLGSSGVGKSTLLNALSGTDLQRVQAVREMDSRGRHTTTHRQLFALPTGALMMDTPGMRELEPWDAADGLAETFAEIEALAVQCRFADCGHTGEPGCAVQCALDNGHLDPERFENYRKLQRELHYQVRKEDPVVERAEQRRWKEIAKLQKRINKERGR